MCSKQAMSFRYEFSYDIERDRDELTANFLNRFERFKERMPSELLADIIFEVCCWRIGNRDMHLAQRAYCDFSCRKIFINPRLKEIARKQRVDPLAFKRAVLAHELGHIRLHRAEMESLDLRSYTGPGQGYDDPRRRQREAEADLYAAVFCLPWEKIIQEPCGDAPNLAKRFGITTALANRALAAYSRQYRGSALPTAHRRNGKQSF